MIESLGPRLGSAEPLRVVIAGGGVTGLTAAYALHRERPDLAIDLFEARPELGGNIRTERADGFVIDAGPDSFIRTKPDALELCRELGLERELVPTRPSARRVFVAHQGRLEQMPGGMALAVPTRIAPLLETPLLSTKGKARMLAEPLVPRGSCTEDESIEAFFERRVGTEGTRRLAAPLLGGIYAGDIAELSIRSTFPQLLELEQRHGSLLRGFLAAELARTGSTSTPRIRQLEKWLRRGDDTSAPSPFLSLRGGMRRLIEALANTLPASSIHCDAPVTGLTRLSNGAFRVDAGPRTVIADAVIVATPARVAASLVPDRDAARELSEIKYVSTATIFFGLDRRQVQHPLDGVGFIVPEGEARILAATWVSSKWDDRAPDTGALVRAFVGGTRDSRRVESSSDDDLVALAKQELERFMGPLGNPRFTRVYRYTNGNPQPVVGHAARMARLKERLAKLPRLHLVGASYEGVGIPDCVRQGRAAARAVARELVELATPKGDPSA